MSQVAVTDYSRAQSALENCGDDPVHLLMAFARFVYDEGIFSDVDLPSFDRHRIPYKSREKHLGHNPDLLVIGGCDYDSFLDGDGGAECGVVLLGSCGTLFVLETRRGPSPYAPPIGNSVWATPLEDGTELNIFPGNSNSRFYTFSQWVLSASHGWGSAVAKQALSNGLNALYGSPREEEASADAGECTLVATHGVDITDEGPVVWAEVVVSAPNGVALKTFRVADPSLFAADDGTQMTAFSDLFAEAQSYASRWGASEANFERVKVAFMPELATSGRPSLVDRARQIVGFPLRKMLPFGALVGFGVLVFQLLVWIIR